MALLRSIATVGGNNLASRILGFLRDILIARMLGTGPVADAFFVALRFPNLFRSLFAEGAFNSAFVPMFVRHLEEGGRDGAKRFAEAVLAVLLTVLLVFTVAAQIAMPWLMYVIAPGFSEQPDKFALAVLFTQITFPYLLFMSLTALQGGILNGLQRFGHAAAAPILLNVTTIIALAGVAPFTGMPGHTLVWAVAAAGVLQFLWLVYACARAGMALRLPRPRLTPAVRRVMRLMLPGIVGAGVMQINLLIGTAIASGEPGAVSWLYYADRIYQFPLAIVGSATGVVLLPSLARSLRGNRPVEAMATLNRGLEFSLFLTLPAMAALIAIPVPIVTVLYERGAFGDADTLATAGALAAYAIGLPAYVLVKALTPGFFAREDTATPFRFAIVAMLFNIAAAVGLSQVIGFVGIALATALSSWLNTGMLGWTLRRRGHLALDARLKRRFLGTLASSVLLGAALWLAARGLEPALAGPTLARAGALGLLVVGGTTLFLLAAIATGGFRLGEFRASLRRQ